MHSLISQALENTCANSQALKKRKRVVIQSSTLFLPANTLNTLGKMMNGEWKCQYVDIALITNPTDTASATTADVVSRFQVQSLLQFHKQHSKNARLKFYEQRYLENGEELASHANITVLGDDLLIGSADATVRSYTMDSHSSIFVRHALQASKAYVDYLDSQIAIGRIIDKTEHYLTASEEELIRESQLALENLAPRSNQTSKLADLGPALKSANLAFLNVKEKAPEPSLVPFFRKPASSAATGAPPDEMYEYNKLWKNF